MRPSILVQYKKNYRIPFKDDDKVWPFLIKIQLISNNFDWKIKKDDFNVDYKIKKV